MPTANHEVLLCKCGHGQHLHDKLGDTGLFGTCHACTCHIFEASHQAQEALKAGETRRRLTED
jgi:hypothetical protein